MRNSAAPDDFCLVPVGRVRSPLREMDEAPRQGRDEGLEADIEVFEEYAEALDGVAGWERLQVVCWMHLAARDRLRVTPRRNPSHAPAGVFATRSPARPNPLAIYTVELLEVQGTMLRVRGVDAVDGTPVVDIRPHVERLDG